MPERPGAKINEAAELLRRQRTHAAGVAAQVAKEHEEARSSGVPAEAAPEPSP